MELTVKQVSCMTGISVRTLHYYDQIGLLHPSATTPAGYRLYDWPALQRLQNILFFRELDFPLSQIAAILDNPDFDIGRALEQQRRMMVLKRERLDRLIGLLDRIKKGENTMSFQEFDRSELEQYRKEAAERWGKTDTYQQSKQHTKGYTKEDYTKIQSEAEALFHAFASLVGTDAASESVQELVQRWHSHICRYFYDCPVEVFSSLGNMYVEDLRFCRYLDGFGAGTAQLMSEAIEIYCAKCY